MTGLGVGAWLAADGAADAARADCAARPAPCEPALGSSHAWRGVAIGSWVAAGALGVIAVVVALPGSNATRPVARLGLVPGGVTASVGF